MICQLQLDHNINCCEIFIQTVFNFSLLKMAICQVIVILIYLFLITSFLAFLLHLESHVIECLCFLKCSHVLKDACIVTVAIGNISLLFFREFLV